MKPSGDFSSRYKSAKSFREAVRSEIEEMYRFVAPDRKHDFSRKKVHNQSDPVTDVFSSFSEEMGQDLAGDLVTFYTPAEARWAEMELLTPVPKEAVSQVQGILDDHENKLFNLINTSNYNDIAPQVTFEAATHGTPAMWVQHAHLAQPIFCEVVPPHELLIVPGHLGILDRFREKVVYARTLKTLFAGIEVTFPDDIQKKMAKPDETVTCCWGYWVDWSDPGNPVWHYEITVEGKRITDENQPLGPLQGACPLLVGRFNPRPGRPWGRGPGLKALPDMLMLDTLEEAIFENIDWQLDPAFKYPDNGRLDLSEGIERGTGIPVSPGAGDDLGFISPGGSTEQGFFTKEDLENRIRTAFFQDGPRQKGDTPPTAAQWLDERRRVQQRLNKPSAPLWTELYFPFIQRVEYLGAESGRLDQQISHNGEELKVQPISPLQKAQNQDKVMITRSNLDVASQVFGESLAEVIDVRSTIENIRNASGDELLVLNEVQNETAAPEAA